MKHSFYFSFIKKKFKKKGLHFVQEINGDSDIDFCEILVQKKSKIFRNFFSKYLFFFNKNFENFNLLNFSFFLKILFQKNQKVLKMYILEIYLTRYQKKFEVFEKHFDFLSNQNFFLNNRKKNAFPKIILFVCDSINTAKCLYKSYNDIEFNFLKFKIDLRFSLNFPYSLFKKAGYLLNLPKLNLDNFFFKDFNENFFSKKLIKSCLKFTEVDFFRKSNKNKKFKFKNKKKLFLDFNRKIKNKNSTFEILFLKNIFSEKKFILNKFIKNHEVCKSYKKPGIKKIFFSK
jgi:hypothetical protein